MAAKGFKLERLQKELLKLTSAIFNGEIDDPRLSGIDITQIKLTSDLSLMKIYFTGYPENMSLDKFIELLNKSSGFIKKQIAGANIMRTIPQISFHYDNTSKRVEKIEEIFKQIAAQKKNYNYYDDDNDNEFYEEEDEIDEGILYDNDEYNEDLEDDLDFDYDEIEDEEDE